MTEFNIGDRVRFVINYAVALRGDEGVIRSHGGDYPIEDRLHYIDLDNGHYIDGVFPSRLELVEPAVERVTDNDEKEGTVSESKWSDEALEIARKAAKVAEDNNYCAEYDRIATASGLPTRAELKELDPTEGSKYSSYAYAVGDDYQSPIIKIGDSWYFVRGGNNPELELIAESDRGAQTYLTTNYVVKYEGH